MRNLIIDGNNLAARNHFIFKDHNTEDGLPSGLIYGCISSFKGMAMFNPDRIIVCWDLGKSQRRIEMYPRYKENRKPKTEEANKEKDSYYKKVGFLRNVVKKVLEFPFVGVKGVEADDLMGIVAHYFKDEKNFIISSDKDLLQLITENTKVYRPQQKQIWDLEEIKKQFDGLTPNDLISIKAIQGDSGDDIPGLPSVGPKTAIKIIKEFKTIEKLLEESKNPESFLKTIKQYSKIKKQLLSLEEITAKNIEDFITTPKNVMDPLPFDKEIFTQSETLDYLINYFVTQIKCAYKLGRIIITVDEMLEEKKEETIEQLQEIKNYKKELNIQHFKMLLDRLNIVKINIDDFMNALKLSEKVS